jgi:hypothetical protein
MQRLLLGGVFAMAVCGAATAKPPTGPLSVGREPDPVTREYYHGEEPTPPAENGPSRAVPNAPDASAWPLLTTFTVLDSVMSGVTLPLGPFPMNEM